MITLFISLFFGASFVTTVALVAACILSGRTQEASAAETVMVSVESLHGIAEVELPNYSQRRQSVPVHAGI
jgi:predicted membrane protein